MLATVLVASLLLVGVKPADAAFPDQNGKIAFVSTRDDGNGEIYVMNAAGTVLNNLTGNNNAHEITPNWSPDGKKIAFTTDRDGNPEIYKMNANGGAPVRLTKNVPQNFGTTFTKMQDFAPVWSPDGTRIAFETDRNHVYGINDGVVDYEVYTMDAVDTDSDGNGENQINRTNDPEYDSDADWQPI